MIFITTILIIFISCLDDESFSPPEIKPGLKSATALFLPNCDPAYFDLLVNQNHKVGEIMVSNNDKYLMIEILPFENISFTEFQMWIGTNPKKVLTGINKLPAIDKFNYRATSPDDLVFMIPLSEIYNRDPATACEAKKLCIFAHAVADMVETAEPEQIQAWSSGTAVGNSNTVSYSSYTTCCQATGGGGCFPHMAWGGETNIGNEYFYKSQKGGTQNIFADNGAIAGWVKFDTGVLTFSFNQDWMFNDLLPLVPQVEITGYYQPGSAPTQLFTGEPSSYQGIYSLSISSYPYYKIRFNLQNCSTGNQ